MRDRWLRFLLPLAVAVGLAIAYVDSRPRWDDTGITVAAVLAVSGALGLVRPQRPWLWALAVGLWIPAANIALHRNYGALIAVAFAFAGAYAGAFLRHAATGIGKTA